MDEQPAIQIVDLRKSYGRRPALRGVNLQVETREILGFLGPNGAGKTTTIRCLLNLIRPQAGLMRVFGIDPQKDPLAVRERTGYLPGELNLESQLTPRRLFQYFFNLRGQPCNWLEINRLAERLDLALDVPVKNLSKGNKQKVGLIQALMARPNLLLLDEPTSGLDPLIQREVLQLIREARDKGATVFFSSHIIREVETIADRVLIIRDGVITDDIKPGHLTALSVRRIRLRFRDAAEPSVLLSQSGVTLLSREGDKEITLQVKGEIDPLLKVLAAFSIDDMQVEPISLEETFLAAYPAKNPGEAEHAG